MKSPFPGMDPYIEACGLWEGFHGHLIEAIYQALARTLPRGYTIDTSTRSYIVMIETERKKAHLAKPDVAITAAAAKRKPHKKKGGVAVAEKHTTEESVSMRAFVAEKVKETFVEIYAEREERFLVTCIEVLSPTHKRPGAEGWKEYERKRQAMLLGRANFIEIDLLRGGQKMPMLDDWPDCPYSLLLCRQVDAPYCRVWPAHYQRQLPTIPVPLAEPDPDLSLDLQPLIDGIYELGRYNERIDYGRKLSPALSVAEIAWVREQLRNQTT
jgi:hypothetical protein